MRLFISRFAVESIVYSPLTHIDVAHCTFYSLGVNVASGRGHSGAINAIKISPDEKVTNTHTHTHTEVVAFYLDTFSILSHSVSCISSLLISVILKIPAFFVLVHD